MDRSDYLILVVWWYTNRQVNNLSQRRCKMYSRYILSNLVNNHSVLEEKKNGFQTLIEKHHFFQQQLYRGVTFSVQNLTLKNVNF
jgi:hypothetical protein